MDRRQLRDLDVGIIVSSLALVVVGVVMIYSATHVPEAQGVSPLVKKQLLVMAVGVLSMIGLTVVSQDSLEALVPFAYGLLVLILLAVLAVGVG